MDSFIQGNSVATAVICIVAYPAILAGWLFVVAHVDAWLVNK